jgi:hypothetical protein
MCNQRLSPLTLSSNRVHGEVYSIQHYVMKFVSDLWQVSDFLRVIQFPPPIKLTVWNNVAITVSYHTTSLTVLNNHSELSHYVTDCTEQSQWVITLRHWQITVIDVQNYCSQWHSVINRCDWCTELLQSVT